MSLSCYCGDYEIEQGMWFWQDKSELKPMPPRKRRIKCASCKKLINNGENVSEFYRYMQTEEDSIEYRIHGEEKRIASWFECEECSDLREALEELGFCVNLGEFMRDLIDEYNEIRKEANIKK